MLSPSIRVLPTEAAVAEDHHLAQDVEAETPTAKSKPVLPIAYRDAFELLDVVPAGKVIGV
jgi:hypothetical protein